MVDAPSPERFKARLDRVQRFLMNWRCLCSLQLGWNEKAFKVPSNLSCCVILWFFDSAMCNQYPQTKPWGCGEEPRRDSPSITARHKPPPWMRTSPHPGSRHSAGWGAQCHGLGGATPSLASARAWLGGLAGARHRFIALAFVKPMCFSLCGSALFPKRTLLAEFSNRSSDLYVCL